MAAEGELSGLPPGATGGDWKVLLPVARSYGRSQSSGPAEQSDDAPDAPEETSEIDPAPMRDEETTPHTHDVPTGGQDSPAVVTGAARRPAEERRGEGAAIPRQPTSESGWVTTQQAARALGISARTVRWHIERGNLEAKPEGEGVERAWRVSVDSLHAFRDSRQATAPSARDNRAPDVGADVAAADPGSAIRELDRKSVV